MNSQGIDFAPVHYTAHQHGADDTCQKYEIVDTFQFQRLFYTVFFRCRNALLAIVVSIQKKINHQKHDDNQQHMGQDVEGPEE